jgi:rhodanese-related sulfurtransferase
MKLQRALKASNLNTRISTGSGSITMQASELSQRIRKHSAPQVIDVRSGLEFKRGHTPGAIHAPVLKILLKNLSL